MRRVLASASAALLLTAALGCHHVAGVCDCCYNDACCVAGPGAAHSVIKQEPIQAEPIKAMPKAGDPAPGKEE